MNILPKKRWHVRTKDNIARVRKDEAEARAKELVVQQQKELAESEARVNFLRKKSGLPERHIVDHLDTEANSATASSNQHIDLFADYKSHIRTTNKDLEKEKKEEQEKYEKQIGYLTYLGQDTNEALKLCSWYEVAPKRSTATDAYDAVSEKDSKIKQAHDPLTLINALLPPEKATEKRRSLKCLSPSAQEKDSLTASIVATCAPILRTKRLVLKDEPCRSKKTKKEKKHKKEKRHKSKHSREEKLRIHKDKIAREVTEKQQKKALLEKLRKDRLRREAVERARQDALLALPQDVEAPQKDSKALKTPRIVQKYNSQFNPELAKQNMI